MELCTELVNTCESFNFNDLDLAFNLIVKPASMSLEYLKAKKDPDALDVFFLKTIELFQIGVKKAEQAGQLEFAHKARLMCIDVHKLRLLAFVAVDRDALDFTLNYLEDILYNFPSDGRFWFQHAIINFSFIPEKGKIKSFSALNSLLRALLAKDNPVEVTSVAVLLERRVTVDFSNTLLNLALQDFRDFAFKDLQTWSFVKYFDSFIAAGSENFISHSELASILLFVLAFFRKSQNSFHLRIFFESFLSAKNQSISEFWPFAVFCLLQLFLKSEQNFEISDAIWFKIFQLLKNDFTAISTNSLIYSSKFKTVLNGTFLSDNDTGDSGSSYDFDEEFSIERDSIITCIAEYFKTEPFNKFITMRSDRTLRLGSHFLEKESEDDEIDGNTATTTTSISSNMISGTEDSLDNSIEELRTKLANLSSNPQHQTKGPLDYLNHNFIIDTNVLLSGSPAIRTELIQNSERFLIPLVVLSEISKLCDSFDKSVYAQDAWNFLQPFLSNLKVYNSYGRLLRPLEISQQLAILSLTRTLTLNDDQIIELAIQFHKNFPKLHKPVLITEDINMRLKAKSKSVRSISIKDFRNLCNC